MSEFTPAQLAELETIIAERTRDGVVQFLTQRLVTPHDPEAGPFAFDAATPNIDQTRKASIDSTRINLNDLNSRVSTINGNYLPLTGGTMTGDIVIGGGVDNISRMHLQAPAAGYADILWSRGGKLRYNMTMSSDAESGGNVGTSFVWYRYDDAGSTAYQLLNINRANGNITHYGQFTITDVTDNRNGVLWFGNQSQGNRSLSYNAGGFYSFGSTNVPLRVSGYQLHTEPQITVTGSVAIDVFSNSALLLLVDATAAVTFNTSAFFGHVQLRVVMRAAATLTFPGVAAWLGEAAPTFVNGQTYFVNLFFVGSGAYGQSVKVGA